MGKKLPKPDADGVLRTGIYARQTRKLRGPEMRAALMELVDHSDLADDLRELRAALKRAGQDSNREIVRDAGRATVYLDGVEHLLRKLGSPAAELMVREAMALGAICEQMNVRTFEHAAKIGQEKIKNADVMRDAKKREDQRRAAEKRREAASAMREAAQELQLDAAQGELEADQNSGSEKTINQLPPA